MITKYPDLSITGNVKITETNYANWLTLGICPCFEIPGATSSVIMHVFRRMVSDRSGNGNTSILLSMDNAGLALVFRVWFSMQERLPLFLPITVHLVPCLSLLCGVEMSRIVWVIGISACGSAQHGVCEDEALVFHGKKLIVKSG